MQTIVAVLIDGLSYSSYLFIVSVGLTVIFGVMKILNVAHGSFYAWGAYAAAWSIGLFHRMDFPAWLGFVLIVASAVAVGTIIGLAIERIVLRKMYEQEEVLVLLATFGVFLILEDAILLVFGVNPYFAWQPMALLGSVKVAGVTHDVYSLTLVGLAIFIALACWLCLARSRWGKILKVVIFDREIGLAMGIDVNAVYVYTFVAGAMLGALGGAAIAPTISVSPGIGIDVIVLSFAVVVIGGMGSIAGAIIGALMVGLLRATAVHFVPELELFVVFAVMAAVLVIRPEGLFAPARVRRI